MVKHLDDRARADVEIVLEPTRFQRLETIEPIVTNYACNNRRDAQFGSISHVSILTDPLIGNQRLSLNSVIEIPLRFDNGKEYSYLYSENCWVGSVSRRQISVSVARLELVPVTTKLRDKIRDKRGGQRVEFLGKSTIELLLLASRLFTRLVKSPLTSQENLNFFSKIS